MHLMNAFGIPIRVHWSFLVLVAGYAIYALASGGMSGLGIALVLGTALFASVVLHELGHALAARHYNIDTAHITLYPFGGVAAIKQMPRTAREEFVIAIAGPAVNVALTAIFGALYLLVGGRLILIIAAINLIMGVFNLIPAFPMDGGRVLRAALSTRMGWLPATELSLRVAGYFAWAFIGLGVLTTSLNLLFIGGFLHFAIASERRRVRWSAHHGEPPSWTRPRSHSHSRFHHRHPTHRGPTTRAAGRLT